MVSSIENRVRSADRSATNSDLRTRASSRSRTANSSTEPADRAGALPGRIRRRRPNTVAAAPFRRRRAGHTTTERRGAASGGAPARAATRRAVGTGRSSRSRTSVTVIDCRRDAASSMRQRDPVEASADLDDGLAWSIIRPRDLRRHRAGALDEQRCGSRVDVQRRHGPELFIGHPQSFAAGGQDLSRSPIESRIFSIRSAAASRTCSQLSNTSSRDRPSNAAATLSARLNPGCWVIPSTAATASGTAAGSPTGANSMTHTPSGKSLRSRAATSNASRVLPTPPTPVSVTIRCAFSSASSSANSASRPMKLVVGCRRFPGVGSSVLSGGNSVRKPEART